MSEPKALIVTPLTKQPPPAFASAAEAKRWLDERKKHGGRLTDQLAQQLEHLQAAPLPPEARAPILEALRAEVVASLNAQRTRFVGQARPLPTAVQTVLGSNERLGSALATGYLQCAQDFAAAGADPNWVAVGLHRALVTLGSIIEDHFLAGVEAPAGLWQRAHAIAAYAIDHQLGNQLSADPLVPETSQCTLPQIYGNLALTAVFDPAALDPGSLQWLQRLLLRWRDLTRLSPVRGSSDKERWINLRLLEAPTRLALKQPAWLEVGGVRAKLRKRLEALAAGETPESLHLGKELSAARCHALLDQFRLRLREAYEPSAMPHAQLTGDTTFLASSIVESFALMTGERYHANEKAGIGTDRVLHDRMALFGQDSVIRDLASDRPKFGEEWGIERSEGDLQYLSGSVDMIRNGLALGQIVVMRQGRVFVLGKVTRALVRQSGKVEATIRQFAGEVRAADGLAIVASKQSHHPIVLLGEVPDRKQPAVIFLGTDSQLGPRQVLQTNLDHPRRLMLGPLLDRGPNFEAYRLDPA